MKKRNLIALLMAVCMMFSLLPVNAIAVGDEGTVPAEETLLSENGNDPAPAGSTNPAGDKDSIPGTGEKPSAAEEPVKDEESAKDEEPGKDEEPAEDEEGGKTNVVPMRVVRPDTDKYLTYVFRVDGAEVSRQIVKKGDTLYQPVSPVKDGYNSPAGSSARPSSPSVPWARSANRRRSTWTPDSRKCCTCSLPTRTAALSIPKRA